MLDEHHDRTVASKLRERGHDAIAVTERDELMALPDLELLMVAASERRAIVTESVHDFAVAHRWYFDSGKQHYGMIFTERRRYRRSRASPGRLVQALADFLDAHRGEGDLCDQVHWL